MAIFILVMIVIGIYVVCRAVPTSGNTWQSSSHSSYRYIPDDEEDYSSGNVSSRSNGHEKTYDYDDDANDYDRDIDDRDDDNDDND